MLASAMGRDVVASTMRPETAEVRSLMPGTIEQLDRNIQQSGARLFFRKSIRVGANDLALAQPPGASVRDSENNEAKQSAETPQDGGCCQQRLVLPFVSLSTFEDWLIRSTGCEDQVIFVEGIIRDLGELLDSKEAVKEHPPN